MNNSHTGTYLCEQLQDSLAKWDIKDSQVHLFLRDNANNMIRAMKDAGYASQGCMAHTLQLVVKDGILTQCAAVDLLAICRRVESHFKHSSTACKQLHEIQQNLGLPQHTLKQDVSTWWNSMFYMLQSVIEQNMSLAAYATENDIPQLSSYQLELVVEVLSPIE